MRIEFNSNNDDPLSSNSANYAQPMSNGMARIVCYVLLAVGILLLGIATFLYMRQVEFMKTAIKSPARITELFEDTGEVGKDDTVYRAQLAFTAQDGKDYQVRSTIGYSRGLQSVGDQVEVIYAPGKPQEADLDSFFGNWISIILYGMGLTFFGLSSLGLYITGRKKQNA
jgi:Protein of unknown function (DUF3592)